MEATEIRPTGLVGFGSEPAGQEREDDDYLAELTRQMANYMLQDDDKSWGGSGSPQSTLGSPFGFGSGSSIGPSPPLTPAWEEMKVKQALIIDQIRSAQSNFRKIKEDREREKREQRNRHDGVFGKKASDGNYQRSGSGMKAVFLDGWGSRPRSAGTGVFLPRGTGAVSESRKRTGGSRVIIPARVVEALKLHFDNIGAPPKFASHLPPHHHATNNGSSSWQRPRKGKQQPPADLPPEWTY
ncbi:PREDICTED: uncharacterized protein LOC104814893 isoform X2 [Tarenaya hassleriana]|uniref:uncharacterized protein LOC104814893 isoform X2 n=1 Tax=Tarenaya hassleriana TaxID=28532 RepID=UPI00053C5877|nr:PREDICTED: uncharacterized protein LOC104814893 isoform X2 [Tarenaya hassleriana]